MATMASTHAPKEHIHRFETKVTAAKQAVAGIPGDDYWDEIWQIVHHPGWTTLAEGLFFEAAVESIMFQTKQLAVAHQQLLAASKAVSLRSE